MAHVRSICLGFYWYDLEMKNRVYPVLLLWLSNFGAVVIWEIFVLAQRKPGFVIYPGIVALLVLPFLCEASIRFNKWLVHVLNSILSIPLVGGGTFLLLSLLGKRPDGINLEEVAGSFVLGGFLGLFYGGIVLLPINIVGFRLVSNYVNKA